MQIKHGDVLEVLRTLPDCSHHALLTDPPYGLRFMSKRWDYDVPSVDVWREALRVLRPGAPLLAFGGTRTWHRIAVAIEDAGFEIRDSLCWMYGSGFPKSLDVGKAIDKAAGAERAVVGAIAIPRGRRDGTSALGGSWQESPSVTAPATDAAKQWHGYGTALKPAFEPVILARKPLAGTVAENVQRWGCGALAIDACRVGAHAYTQEEWTKKGISRSNGSTYGKHRGSDTPLPLGRWPANVILDEEAGRQLDLFAGERKGMSGGGKHAPGYTGGMFGAVDSTNTARGDTGGASRFFYCPKASRREREAGLDGLPHRSAGEVTGGRADGSAGLDSPRAGAGRTGGARNTHPTVKPLALVEYLARLILPPIEDGVILVPYSGSGSELIGAWRAGWTHGTGIEREAEYIEIAKARLTHARA